MKLRRIVLEDIRQYAGRQELTFSQSKAKNVTLIRGLNGAGKTHLLEALRWCLYGTGNWEDARDLVAKSTVAETTTGKEFDSAVSVHFDHDGRSYEARRTIRVKVGATDPAGNPTFGVSDKGLTLYQHGPAGDAREVSAPNEELRGILPREAADYFFFDAEKIDAFAKPDNAKGIKAAVDQVLKLTDLDRAIGHLDAVAGEYEKRLRALTHDAALDALLAEKDQKATERDDLAVTQEATGKELAAARVTLAQIEAELLKMADAQEHMQQKAVLEDRLNQALRLQAESDRKLGDLAPQLASLASLPALLSAGALAASKRKKGEIPSRIRQVVVQDLLQSQRCLCGRELMPGTEPHHTMLELIQTSVTTRLEEKVITTAAALPGVRTRAERLRAQVQEVLLDRHRATKAANDSQEAIADIKNQLADVRQEDVRELMNRRRQIESDVQDLSGTSIRGGHRLAELEREIGVLQTKVSRVQLESVEARKVQVRASLSRDAAAALRETREKFAAEVRERLETGTAEMFKALVWKEAHFDRVELSPEFQLSVVDKWGQQALGDLSAGETEVLSLSFIVTMGRVAGEAVDSGAPVVIDTPFGRLSGEPRANICRMLPGMVDQLVLFVTDTELVGTEKELPRFVGSSYELKFDPDASTTSIVEVPIQ